MPETAESTSTAVTERSERSGRSSLRALVSSTAFSILLVDVALILIFGFWSEDYVFLSVASFQNVASNAAVALILAVAITVLLGAGELDISLGATLLLASVFGGKAAAALIDSGTLVAALVALAICIAVGAGIGLVNALVVTRLKVNSLIATLAMLGIATGVANIATNGTDLGNVPAALQEDFGLRLIAGIPLPAFIALAVWAAAWLMFRYSRFGLHLLALGSSRDAAERAGLKVALQLTIAFVVVGALAGLAGFLDLTRFATTNLAGHDDDALAALTAAVIGGTSLFGGRVSIAGVFAGTLLAQILQDGLVVIGLSAFYQLIAVGVVLIIAIALDQRRRGSRVSRLPGTTQEAR